MSRIDELYARFEERFRGPRKQILARLQTYAPLLELFERRGLNRHALDLGCGRGEWLQLLGERGWDARGVDTNDRMLEEAAKYGVRATYGDAIAHMQALPDRSVNLVSAFHLVEHLPAELLLTLLAEASRILSPDGLIVLETPNPENLVVGTSSFYLDPTHVKPLPPPLLQFYVEQSGMAVSEILRINGESDDKPIESLEAALRPFFRCALDYAIVGSNTADAVLSEEIKAFVRTTGQGIPTALEGIQQLDHHRQSEAAGIAAMRSSEHRATGESLAHVHESLHHAITAVHGGMGSIDHRLSMLERAADDVLATLNAHEATIVQAQAMMSEEIREAHRHAVAAARVQADAQTEMIEETRKAHLDAVAVARLQAGAQEQRVAKALAQIGRQLGDIVARQAETSQTIESLRRKAAQDVDDAVASTAAIYRNSTSWRATAPLRALSAVIKRERRPSLSIPRPVPPAGRGLLGNQILWKIGKTAIGVVPGARMRALKVLAKQDLLTNPLAMPLSAVDAEALGDGGSIDFDDTSDTGHLPRRARILYERIRAAQDTTQVGI